MPVWENREELLDIAIAALESAETTREGGVQVRADGHSIGSMNRWLPAKAFAEELKRRRDVPS